MSKTIDLPPDEDEPVGYRRPPRSGQFRKGQSGNPKGRPRRPLSLQEMFGRVGSQLVTVRDGRGNRRVPMIEALALKTYQAALSGDQKAAALIVKLYETAQGSRQPEAGGNGGDGLVDGELTEDDIATLRRVAEMQGATFPQEGE